MKTTVYFTIDTYTSLVDVFDGTYGMPPNKYIGLAFHPGLFTLKMTAEEAKQLVEAIEKGLKGEAA